MCIDIISGLLIFCLQHCFSLYEFLKKLGKSWSYGFFPINFNSIENCPYVNSGDPKKKIFTDNYAMKRYWLLISMSLRSFRSSTVCVEVADYSLKNCLKLQVFNFSFFFFSYKIDVIP